MKIDWKYIKYVLATTFFILLFASTITAIPLWFWLPGYAKSLAWAMPLVVSLYVSPLAALVSIYLNRDWKKG